MLLADKAACEMIERLCREFEASCYRSEEVKSYLQNLCMGSKPESALREALFAGNSVLGTKEVHKERFKGT